LQHNTCPQNRRYYDRNICAIKSFICRMRRGNAFSRVCVCLSVYLVRALTIQSLDIEASFLICSFRISMSRLSIKFKVIQAHAGGLPSTKGNRVLFCTQTEKALHDPPIVNSAVYLRRKIYRISINLNMFCTVQLQ